MKFFNPPRILLDPGKEEWVLLGGEILMLAVDTDKNYYNVSRISGSYMRGVFDKDIPDQIKDFEFDESDDEATVNPEVLVQRIINGFDEIIKQKLIFVGLASFEGNAFSTEVFRSYDISMEDINNLFKKMLVTLKRGFPVLQKGNYINTSFIGQAAGHYEFKTAQTSLDIESIIKKSDIESIGIVTSSQGAANIFLLNSEITENGVKKDLIENNNLQTIRSAMAQGQITPISWVKFDLGLKSFETLSNWEELKENNALIQKIQAKMTEYEKQLAEMKKIDINPDELGEVDINSLSEEEKKKVLKNLNECKEKLEELLLKK